MDRYKKTAGGASDSPPSEAWLFAQAILGKPVPNPYQARDDARVERERLEWLAQISPRHAGQLRRLQSAEAEARRQRELLEWLAQISTEHEAKLRTLLRKEVEAQEVQDRHEQFYEAYSGRINEWAEVDHPRQPKGTPEGGQWVAKGGGSGGARSFSASGLQRDRDVVKRNEHSPTQNPKAKYVRDFEKDHDLTLQRALKNGKLSAGDILRMKFTDDEIKQILGSAEKPGSDLNLTFYTAQNLPARLRTVAEKDFANLPGDEKYAMQAFVSNQRRARTILLFRNPAFQEYVGQLYGLLRSLNPTHFTVEKGVVVAISQEPVLGGEASRLDALKEMLIYLAVMKGVGWGTSKISNIIAGPEAAGEITIAFEGGGKLTIRRGAEYGPETLQDAVERAAAGRKVEINSPAPKPPLPSLRSADPASAQQTQRASLGQATTSNYTKTFFNAHPELKGKVIVHHEIEQQVQTRYPGVLTESELHSLENLRRIPKDTNAETHLSAIRREWNRFYDHHPTATKDEILEKATEIDNKYGHFFHPPIR